MKGLNKALLALGALLTIGGSMLAPLDTASAQTMTQCERFQYNWCLAKWDHPNFADYGWDSPGECYAELRESQCGAWTSALTDPGPLYRKEVAKA